MCSEWPHGECGTAAEFLPSVPLPPGHSGIRLPHPVLHPHVEGGPGVDRGQDQGAWGGQHAHQGCHVLLQVLPLVPREVHQIHQQVGEMRPLSSSDL